MVLVVVLVVGGAGGAGGSLNLVDILVVWVVVTQASAIQERQWVRRQHAANHQELVPRQKVHGSIRSFVRSSTGRAISSKKKTKYEWNKNNQRTQSSEMRGKSRFQGVTRSSRDTYSTHRHTPDHRAYPQIPIYCIVQYKASSRTFFC